MNKKNVILIVGIVLILALSSVSSILTERQKCSDSKEARQWVKNAITEPKAETLQPAGYITVSWEDASTIGSVKNYKVYLDDKKVGNTKDLTYEVHISDVKKHKVRVEVSFNNGMILKSKDRIFYVNKKGLCMNTEMAYGVNPLEWGASWYYDWAIPELQSDWFKKIQFVPMFWSIYDTNELIASKLKGRGYKYLLTFNEPDLAQQSNLTVDEAIEGMKAFQDTGLIVGSPATAKSAPWSKTWFEPFMNRMKYEKMDVDFIAFHLYWNWYSEGGAEKFLETIDQTYELYKKPIWVTEFAIDGYMGKTKEELDGIKQYMIDVIKGLDEREYVERYAWFPYSTTAKISAGSALLTYYSAVPTELGKTYQQLGMPEGYKADITLDE